MTSSVTLAEDDLPGQPTVLLVDDDEVNLLLTAIALRDRGFAITEATSGEQAIRMLADWTPDVVVLDALMPGLDGFETCRELRATPGLHALPVLMLTGLDDEASINRAYVAGATDFFVKSTQWSLLAGRLRHILRSSRTRQELERSKAKLARAQDLARMGSFDWKRGCGDPKFSIEGMRVLGLDPDETLPFRRLMRMLPATDRRAFTKLLGEVIGHSSVLGTDVPLVWRDGGQRIVHVEAEPEFNEHGTMTGYTGIVQDVTERRAAEDRISRLANFDSLTGLPNRHTLNRRTQRALDHAKRLGHSFALLLIDLDRFKGINDTLGHGAGDELLMQVAQRLRACVRHFDQDSENSLEIIGSRSHIKLEAVGRLGGDEFVALLPEVASDADAQRVAERILEVMRQPINVSGQECFVTASVGIALYPRDGESVADLMRNADLAMYSVKDSGRNSSRIFMPTLAGKGREKLELESALHNAIRNDELVLYYQPKVDVRAGRMVGVEALMRWRRDGKLVSPGDFIPVAEETGLIIPMSEWAIREAARQARVWKDSFGFADSIAVNLPSRMFERNELVATIDEAVSAHHVPHQAIQIEITETGIMHKGSPSLVLHRLKEIGVDIAIDDFGTGYSSLAYLATLPIRELKIDIQFVRDIAHSVHSHAIVKLIIALARSLNLRVVAEGVETLRQQIELHRLGCEVMQGYQYSHPLPGDEIEGWMRSTELPRMPPWLGKAGQDDVEPARLAAQAANIGQRRPGG